ncbi:hypothetical protein [Aliidiomarina minuta]|nr:hypothetical protein [Aliidiomarina minuta]
MIKMNGRQNRSRWYSLSNILYAILTLAALVLFMHDAQAAGGIQAFFMG